MKIRVENVKVQVAKNGKEYYSFWVNIFEGKLGYLDAGWKFFPETGTVCTPSVFKGPNKDGSRHDIKLGKPTKDFYNAVRSEIIRYFGLDEEILDQERGEKQFDKLQEEYAE